MSPRQQGHLFDASDRSPGPIYQGVCKTIRTVDADDPEGRQLRAGITAQARSLAASIDRQSGHVDGSYQAPGDKLAQLHAQLAALMLIIAPELAAPASTHDPFADALSAIFDASQAHDDTSTSHAP